MKRLAAALILISGCSSPRSAEMADGTLALHARRGDKTETVTWKATMMAPYDTELAKYIAGSWPCMTPRIEPRGTRQPAPASCQASRFMISVARW